VRYKAHHQVQEAGVKYRVKLEKTDEGYAVCCPGLPGCWSQGATEEEALENIKDAIETYIATVEELTKDESTRLVEVRG
jgi:predicted RNase H-like HicB family nuclease